MELAVVVPTYNERENIKVLVEELLHLGLDLKIIIVDDNSPDGTGKVADELSLKHKEVCVIHRSSRGRGSAGIAGFKYALRLDADYILEMDADLSHSPQEIPSFLKAIKETEDRGQKTEGRRVSECQSVRVSTEDQGYDLIIGSRYLEGGREVGRSGLRRLISLLANSYIRLILGLKIKDCTSGFRLFRKEALQSLDLEAMKSKGPAIVIETLDKAFRKGYKIREIPITYVERKRGGSTLSVKILLETLFMVGRLKIEPH